MRTKWLGLALTPRALLPLLPTVLGCSGASDALLAPGSTDAALSPSNAGTTDSGLDATDATVMDVDAAQDASDADADVATPSLCTGIKVCDDFELTPAGMPPNPALWALGAPSCVGRGTAVVDDKIAYTGTHSVKVVNDFGDASAPAYCDHMFFSNESAFAVAGAEQVYTRFFVNLGDPLGTSHVTLATMTNMTQNNQIRLGFDDGVFAWNNASTGNFLPELPSGGPVTGSADPIDVQESLPPPSGWFCVEFHIDEIAGTYETWIEGMEEPGLEFDGSAVTNVSVQWAMDGSKPLLSNLGFGWETYAGMPMTLWFDDVAIDTKRIGCTLPDQ